MFQRMSDLPARPTGEEMAEMERELRKRLTVFTERGMMFSVDTAVKNFQVKIRTPYHTVSHIIRDGKQHPDGTVRERMWKKELKEKLEETRKHVAMKKLRKLLQNTFDED